MMDFGFGIATLVRYLNLIGVLEANLVSLYYGSLTALCIGLAALLLPEPNSIYFRPAFMCASLIGAIAAISTLIAWRTA
ncbi:MAG: hypothetical protein ACFFCW_43620 [Candidatus Hodarchaeota archaeon]